MADKFLFGQLLLITFLICSNLAAFSPTILAYEHPPAARILIPRHHHRSDPEPQQVHVSLAGNDHMKVSWVTNDINVPSRVDYGTVKGIYNASATGFYTSYKYLFYRSGKIHHVKIGPLSPKTIYYYKCGGQGREFSFRTPPSTFPIDFVVMGDLGQSRVINLTLTKISNLDYDVLLSTGDLSLADQRRQRRWDSFGRLVEPLASKRPWMVTQGSRDIERLIHPKLVDTFKAYNARWHMPFKESGSNSNLYYSFDVVGAHIIMLGSYAKYDVNSDQYKWLEADLSKIDRSVMSWLIVVLHVPWYNTNKDRKGEGEGMRRAMEELLYKARVDIVFSGHVHANGQFTRLYNHKPDPCGPIHITIGDGVNKDLAKKFLGIESPSFTEDREASFGYGRLRIRDERYAFWSWPYGTQERWPQHRKLRIESLSMSDNHTCHTNI